MEEYRCVCLHECGGCVCVSMYVYERVGESLGVGNTELEQETFSTLFLWILHFHGLQNPSPNSSELPLSKMAPVQKRWGGAQGNMHLLPGCVLTFFRMHWLLMNCASSSAQKCGCPSFSTQTMHILSCRSLETGRCCCEGQGRPGEPGHMELQGSERLTESKVGWS